MRFLGIDYGEKRIGIALSDEGGQFAFPHNIISNKQDTAEQIQNICKAQEISAIVLGESRTYGGKENPIMRKITSFKKKLELITRLPVHLEPEVLTSQEAKRGRGEKSERPIDDSTAALILQSYLDKEQEKKKSV